MSGERPVPTRYVGDDASRQFLESRQANPRALAAADFDEDGVPDLVSGYAASAGGIITLHRGNVDSIFPNTSAAKQRRATGRFSDSPFLAAARVFAAPAAPDFLQAGDFDADGHSDVLAATRGGDALLYRGDGKGGIHPAERLELPGGVTAMAVGDIKGHDGLPDVVFGIAHAAGAQALLFAGREGILKSKPEAFELPSEATSPTLGDLDAEAVLPMRLNIDARDDLVVLRAGQSAPLVAVTQAETTFVVTNTNDSGPGSLRQAILDANVSDGDGLITFNIPGPGPHTITPLTPLPAANVGEPAADDGTVIIDGTSQPGFAGTPIIELSGAVVGTSGDGLTIGSPGSVVRGLVINRFAVGIRFFQGLFGGIRGGFVEGNYIGTDVRGTAPLGNSTGVVLRTLFEQPITISGVTIGGTVPAARNVISGNGRGIDGELDNQVQGNFIGTDVTGTVALGNALQGVFLSIGALGGQIGGTEPGARNIISGNGDDGIFSDEGFLLVSNNYIGTDVSGARALGNSGDGIELGSFDTVGTISGNVISANGGYGVLASSLANVDLLDNRVGTNSAGTEALGNLRSGILVDGHPGEYRGNLISGNREHGLAVTGLANVIQGNRIGTDITGTAALANLGDGVRLFSQSHTVGGTDSDAGNLIAFNGGAGVRSSDTGPNTILSNAVFSNGGLGIDLVGDGVTPNDACDVDTEDPVLGPQNFPVITAVNSSGASTTIQGQLNSRPNAAYLLQFFDSAAADPSGFGEGARLLGSMMVTTDATCNATFNVTFPVAVAAGHVVTATATNSLMSTSEFSNAVAFVPQTPQEATRLLIQQVRTLVAEGELNKILGLVLELKLRVAIFFMDREHFRAATQQLRGFNQLVAVFVKTGKLGAAQGQALTDAANAIIDQITPSP